MWISGIALKNWAVKTTGKKSKVWVIFVLKNLFYP